MVIHNINTEFPSEHWRYLHIESNDTLLDLGCGRWENKNSDILTTPEYFASLCSDVYGVDCDITELDWFQTQFRDNNKLRFLNRNLSSNKVIQDLIYDLRPDVVKCDIEKNEMHLLNINEDLFKTVRNYGIETHRNWIFDAFISEFPKRGYEVTDVINLIHAYPMKVIFAEKK